MSDEQTPRIRAYLRVSDQRSAGRGNSRAGQIEAIRRCVAAQIPREEVEDRRVLLYEDLGVSAYSTPLAERKAGAQLFADVRPGDHVVFFRLDRAFRNLKDAVSVLFGWREQEVLFHDCGFPGLGDRAVGPLLIAILSWAAEWESSARSQRIRAVDEHLLRTEGRRTRTPPWYLKLSPKRPGQPRYALLDEQRVELLFAMKRMQKQGRGYAEIARIVSRRLDPEFRPTPYTETRDWPISRDRVYKMLQPEYWERFVNCPLLAGSRRVSAEELRG